MPALNGESDSLALKIGEIAAGYVGAKGNVGLAVGIIRGHRQRTFCFGSIDKESGVTPDENTLFEIGSIGKVFTANLLADLAAAGEVTLNDAADQHLPATLRTPRYQGAPITLEHLAMHTSGLPRLPGNLQKTITDQENPYANYTAEHLYEYLSTCRLRRRPGKKVAYSNLGAGLLGHILGRVCETSYEQAVIERICRPLGLTDTCITLSEDQQARFAQGHSSSGQPVSHWDIRCLEGAGGLRSTAKDMLAYAAANLEAGSERLGSVLATCRKPRAKLVTLPAWRRRYGAAIALAAIGVGAQYLFGIRPGRFLFLLPTIPPVLASGFYCGTGAGLLSAALLTGGSHLLWGEAYSWVFALFIKAFIAWQASSRFRDQSLIGLGWHISPLKRGGPQMTWHNGMTGGFASFMGLVRQSRTAVVVLSNSANSVDGIAIKMLQSLDHHPTTAR